MESAQPVWHAEDEDRHRHHEDDQQPGEEEQPYPEGVGDRLGEGEQRPADHRPGGVFQAADHGEGEEEE